jgi:sulfite reductase beta subunit-like hemoprotein
MVVLLPAALSVLVASCDCGFDQCARAAVAGAGWCGKAYYDEAVHLCDSDLIASFLSTLRRSVDREDS